MYNCTPHIDVDIDNKKYYLKNKEHKLKNKNEVNFNFDEVACVLKSYFVLFFNLNKVTFYIVDIINIMKNLYKKYKMFTKKLIFDEMCKKKYKNVKVIYMFIIIYIYKLLILI